MNALQVLVKAKSVLVKRGWCQGRSVAIDGAVCAMAALSLATTGHLDESHSPLIRPAYNVLKRAGAPHGVMSFNDEPRRTKSQVLALFNRAIKLATRKPRVK